MLEFVPVMSNSFPMVGFFFTAQIILGKPALGLGYLDTLFCGFTASLFLLQGKQLPGETQDGYWGTKTNFSLSHSNPLLCVNTSCTNRRFLIRARSDLL